MKNNKPTFIDLFAGCGGLSLGMEQAGFYPLYVNELNKDALETYLINREQEYPHLRDPKFHSQDIKDCINNKFFRNLKTNLKIEFGSSDVDVICGGPPCQGFSGLGVRRSYSVDKKDLPSNHLYEDMANFISEMQPKIFLFENVRGLLNAKWTKSSNKKIFQDVFEAFASIKGYSVKWSLVSAKDYGVPQNRPRVLIVGIKSTLLNKTDEIIDAVKGGFLPKNGNMYPNIDELLSDLVDKNFEYGGESKLYRSDPKTRIQKTLRTNKDGSILAKGDILTEQQYSNHSQRIRDKFFAIIKNNGKIPKEYKSNKFAQRLLPRKWGNKGPSLTITSMPDDFIHYSLARSLTVRECARIQTFPDWYKFVGKRTTGGIRRAGNPRKNIHEREVPKYTQIGNAVPVEMGRCFGEFFKEKLF